MQWMTGISKADEGSERMRGERARQDDTGTSDVVETWNVADSGEGSQGGAAPVMVSDTPGEYSTANRASHWHGRDEDRMTAVRRAHGANRAEVSSGEADATKAGQRKRERTVAEAQAERAPGGAFVLSARPRENSHEGVPENNETRFKTDEEKSGWWEALKKRFYRDMG